MFEAESLGDVIEMMIQELQHVTRKPGDWVSESGVHMSFHFEHDYTVLRLIHIPVETNMQTQYRESIYISIIPVDVAWYDSLHTLAEREFFGPPVLSVSLNHISKLTHFETFLTATLQTLLCNLLTEKVDDYNVKVCCSTAAAFPPLKGYNLIE